MQGIRVNSNVATIVAVAGGAGVAWAATGQILFALPTQRPATRAIIRRLWWWNQTVGPGNILIGWGDRTVAGSLFTQVAAIPTLAGAIDWTDNLPIFGNTLEGFQCDTTPVTGTLGDIIVECDAAGTAALTPVLVSAEIELF